MAKTYRPYVPEQALLLPPSLREWLPEDHLAFFVSDLIDQMDLSAITTAGPPVIQERLHHRLASLSACAIASPRRSRLGTYPVHPPFFAALPLWTCEVG